MSTSWPPPTPSTPCPTKTMLAVADHGKIAGDQVTGQYDEARNVLDCLARLGIPYGDVVTVLEREGIDKFAKSWTELLSTVQAELTRATQ